MRCTLKLSPHVLFCIPAEERFRFVASTTGKLRVLILVWILSRKIQEEKINETNLHYWPKYWLVLQPGNLVWSWQGSCLFLLTARTPLCTSPAMEAHNQSIGTSFYIISEYHFTYLKIYNNPILREEKMHSRHWWSSGPETLLLSPGWSPCLSRKSAAVRTQTET